VLGKSPTAHCERAAGFTGWLLVPSVGFSVSALYMQPQQPIQVEVGTWRRLAVLYDNQVEADLANAHANAQLEAWRAAASVQAPPRQTFLYFAKHRTAGHQPVQSISAIAHPSMSGHSRSADPPGTPEGRALNPSGRCPELQRPRLSGPHMQIVVETPGCACVWLAACARSSA
jgi:hypothetical protein